MNLWEMDEGTSGICTNKNGLFVHRDLFDPPWLDPNAYIITPEADKRRVHDGVMYPGDVYIERVDKGWLVDGVLYTAMCQEECHPPRSLGVYSYAGDVYGDCWY